MATSWDGEERQQQRISDHDLLLRIDGKLDSLVQAHAEHITEDRVTFEKHDRRITQIEKIMYAGIGIIAFIEIIFKVFK